MSEDGIQQGDPKDPPLFAETFQTLVKQMESKIYIWHLAGDYKVVLRGLKNILKLEKIYGLSLNTDHCELCFFGTDYDYTVKFDFNTISKNILHNKKKKGITLHFRISNRRTSTKRVARRKN